MSAAAAAAATPPSHEAAAAPPRDRCVAEARGVLVAATDASLAPSVAVVPDAALEPGVINEALAAVAPVVTLPLPTAAIVAAAAASSRKRRRAADADDESNAAANPLAAFLSTSVPPALRDALRLVGGFAHDFLSVPLPSWAGGDDNGDEGGQDGGKVAAASSAADAALGWSVGGGGSSSGSKQNQGRWLAVAAEPLAAGVLPGSGVAVPAASGAVLVFGVPAAAVPPPATTATARRTRAAAATATPTPIALPALTQPHAVLVHELQRRASCVAWRPGRPNHLAVGCAGGAALWSLAARPPEAAAAAGASPPNAALGPGASTAFCTFLRHRRRARVTSLAWSPDGRLLAGASASSAALAVWDASAAGGGGGGARLRAALSSGLARLAWSPCGRYLFAAGAKVAAAGGGPLSSSSSVSPSGSSAANGGGSGLVGALASALAPPGRFHLWETGRWRSRAWDVPAGGRVVAACWAGGGGGDGASSPSSSSPSGPVAPLLVAMSHASSLVALHLVGGPGTLSEQLLPVALPGVTDVCRAAAGGAPRRGGGGGGGIGVGSSAASSLSSSSDAGCIADLAWDPSARRLAVALRAPHPAAGCVALYATRVAPVVSAQLVGLVRPFAASGEGGGGASRPGAGLRVAFAPQPLLARRGGGGGGGDDAYAPSAAGGAPAAILSVRDLASTGRGWSGGGGGEGEGEEEGEGEGGSGAERIANIALHF